MSIKWTYVPLMYDFSSALFLTLTHWKCKKQVWNKKQKNTCQFVLETFPRFKYDEPCMPEKLSAKMTFLSHHTDTLSGCNCGVWHQVAPLHLLLLLMLLMSFQKDSTEFCATGQTTYSTFSITGEPALFVYSLLGVSDSLSVCDRATSMLIHSTHRKVHQSLTSTLI